MDELDRNRYATQAEAALLREQTGLDEAARKLLEPDKLRARAALKERKRVLRQAQMEVDDAQSVYDEIAARDDELASRISLAHGHFHPLRRVPDEVLAQIFVEWKRECLDCDEYEEEGPKCDHVCMQAAAVCRWWRRVALSARELWCEMTVMFNRVTSSNIDHWLAYLDIHRMRSGRLPLVLDISGDWDDVRPVISGQLWATLKLCFAQAGFVSVRVNSFDLDQRFCECVTQNAPFLAEFRTDIWLDSGTRHALPFFLSAPLLRQLKLCQGIVPRWHPGQSTFSAVTHVDIDGTNAHGVADLFHHMPTISSLKVYSGSLDSAASPGFSLQSDAMRFLDWNTSDICDATLVRRMHFPSLKTAVLGFYDRDAVPDESVTAFLQHPMCTADELTLDYLEVAVLDGLSYTNHVTTLQFNHYTETSEVTLQGLSMPTASGVWLCPQLHTVTLPAYMEHFDPASLREAILAFVRARGPRTAADTGASLPGPLTSLSFERDYRGDTLAEGFAESVHEILKPAVPM
ncbi:hypothetical protein AURDEDRAFT_163125 [Auricularia subglabra TFB-10046 SS5]|nr:hypothetical protein AURDEDRAFT_163125 [Auricularia subglabra TFB-10046 SS5]